VTSFFNDVPLGYEPDQSPKAKVYRLASFLRGLHWKPERIRYSAGKTGVKTPVFLTYSTTDSQKQDASKSLEDLGFTVHLNSINYQDDKGVKEESIRFLIDGMVANKLGPWINTATA
jgi:hypothetical protein